MKITLRLFVVLFVLGNLYSCIGDDFIDDLVDPVLRITKSTDTIQIGTNFQFENTYFNNIGLEETVDAIWSSSNEMIINISPNGLSQALMLGQSLITVEYNSPAGSLKDSVIVNVGEATVVNPSSFNGQIISTSSYELEGDFELSSTGANLVLLLSDNYKASTALPGLYVYLSNNQNSVANALEIAQVEVYNGAHSYTIPDTGLNDYAYILYFCKPFNVKVGEGIIQ